MSDLQFWQPGQPGWYDGWWLDADGSRVRYDPTYGSIQKDGQTYLALTRDSRFGDTAGTPQSYLTNPAYNKAVGGDPTAFYTDPTTGQSYMSSNAQANMSAVMPRKPTNALQAFGQTIGLAMGASGLLAGGLGALASGGGELAGWAGSMLPEGGYQSLLSSLQEGPSILGGATDPTLSSTSNLFGDIYNANADGAFTPATEGDASWGVNPRATAALSGASDPIQALDALDQAGGGQGATAGAQALGFDSVAEALGSINPSWLDAASTGGSILQKLLGSGASSLLPAALSSAATLGAGALGANAASKAAQAGVDASQAAIGEQRRQFDLTRADNAPFLATGTAADLRKRQLLGLDPTYTGADSGSLVKPFTAAAMNADPVYQSGLQFGLDQGTKGINARAIANGTYDSGATLKALTQFGNDYASTKGNDAFNRYQTEGSNIYSRLSGAAGAGQTAASTIASAGQASTNAIGNSITDAGNARAAGIVGGAQAWGSAAQGINSALNNYSSNQILQQLLQQRQPTSLYGV